MKDADEEGFVTKTNMERINNGIFAFTMTLLARNIVIPQIDEPDSTLFFVHLIANIGVGVVNYTVTFLVLAMLWFFIYQIFRNINYVDRRFAYFNFLFLMTLVFVPFCNDLWLKYDENAPAAILILFTFLALGIFCCMMWIHISSRKDLVNPTISVKLKSHLTKKFLVIPALSMGGIILCYHGIVDAAWIFFLALPIYFIFFRDPGEN
jgi:uncharacterized membrane protein